MKEVISLCQDLIIKLRTDNKYTLKAAVIAASDAGVSVIEDATKTKALFLSFLTQYIEDVTADSLLSELDSLKVEISSVIQTAGNASFELGNLLIKARAACENQAEFLEWVDSNFGIKKAWAFKLMKVSQVFEGEPWSKVATSVLYTLHCQASDEQILEAKKFAEIGKLDLSAVKALLQPAIATVKQPQATAEPEALRAADSVAAVIADCESPALSGALEDIVSPESEQEALSPTVDNTSLQVQIQELLALNTQLTAQIQELTKPRLRNTSDMPMLPQFTSSCLYARLGLSQDEAQSKEKVLEAFKALAKAGYGRSHEAFKLLDEARHELYHAAEAQEVAA